MLRTLLAVLTFSLVLAGCGNGTSSGTGSSGTGAAKKKPLIGFVTNCVDPFWTIAEKGCAAAAAKYGADYEVKMPPKGGVAEQKNIIQNLLTRGVDGIAISPLDPANQTEILNEAAANTNLITHDSDAPLSKRLCFIGVDNYSAGRACGKLVKEVLPAGGKLMMFVANIEQNNAKARRQGVIDELLDRSNDPTRFDAPGTELKSADGKFIILDTRTDQADYAKALQNAQDALAKYPDLAGMVGLFAYNTPNCLQALKSANMLGKIKLIGFDENEKTLQGIIDGEVYGTVVQNPYMYGFESVRILTALANGDKSVLPKDGILDIPARQIKKDNVEAFWTELKKLTGN